MKQMPQATQDCHHCLLWLIPQLDKFPRNRRFTLGDKIESGLLVVLEDLIGATYKKNNKKELAHANRQLAVTRHLWRLAFELKVVAPKQYEHGSKLFINIGSQIGGWLKSA